MSFVLVWDIETINDGTSIPDAEARSFPKLIHHSVVCLGALLAKRVDDGWKVLALAVPTTNEMDEGALLRWFTESIGKSLPLLVTFNGNSFDLPVLRYRCMKHEIDCGPMNTRRYFHRYLDDHIDLCDVLSSFNNFGKVSLDDLSKAMGLPGKPDEMDGSKVEGLYREGRLDLIAKYCESDLLNTYRIWLRYELFRGHLSENEFQFSEQSLALHIGERDASNQ